jgi:hypothetical protein
MIRCRRQRLAPSPSRSAVATSLDYHATTLEIPSQGHRTWFHGNSLSPITPHRQQATRSRGAIGARVALALPVGLSPTRTTLLLCYLALLLLNTPAGVHALRVDPTGKYSRTRIDETR